MRTAIRKLFPFATTVFFISAGMALLFWLAGCGGETAPGKSRLALNVWLDASTRELEFFRSIKGLYEETHQGVSLHLRVVRLNDLKPTFLGHASGTAEPDVLLIVNDWIGELAKSDLLLPLPGSFSHLLPTMLGAMEHEGMLLAVPWSFETVALFYNKALVATPPGTIEELVREGRSLLQRGVFPLIYDNKNFYFHAPWFFGFGGTLFGKAGEIVFASPESARALAFAVSLQTEHGIVPPKSNYPAMINLFGSGSAAMIITGPWSLPDIRRSPVSFGIAPVPGIATGSAAKPFLGVKGFAVNRFSRNREAAVEWVRFLGSTEIQWRAARELGTLACCGETGNPASTTSDETGFRAGVRDGVPLPPGEEMKEVWQEANWSLQTAFANPASDPLPILETARDRIRQRKADRAATTK